MIGRPERRRRSFYLAFLSFLGFLVSFFPLSLDLPMMSLRQLSCMTICRAFLRDRRNPPGTAGWIPDGLPGRIINHTIFKPMGKKTYGVFMATKICISPAPHFVFRSRMTSPGHPPTGVLRAKDAGQDGRKEILMQNPETFCTFPVEKDRTRGGAEYGYAD